MHKMKNAGLRNIFTYLMGWDGLFLMHFKFNYSP